MILQIPMVLPNGRGLRTSQRKVNISCENRGRIFALIQLPWLQSPYSSFQENIHSVSTPSGIHSCRKKKTKEENGYISNVQCEMLAVLYRCIYNNPSVFSPAEMRTSSLIAATTASLAATMASAAPSGQPSDGTDASSATYQQSHASAKSETSIGDPSFLSDRGPEDSGKSGKKKKPIENVIVHHGDQRQAKASALGHLGKAALALSVAGTAAVGAKRLWHELQAGNARESEYGLTESRKKGTLRILEAMVTRMTSKARIYVYVFRGVFIIYSVMKVPQANKCRAALRSLPAPQPPMPCPVVSLIPTSTREVTGYSMPYTPRLYLR